MDQATQELQARCLSKEQAAAYLGIGVTLLVELDVPHIRFGRRCVYDKVDIDTWLDNYKAERRRAGKEYKWPEMKDSTGDPIRVAGGSLQRSPTAREYARALGLTKERKRKQG